MKIQAVKGTRDFYPEQKAFQKWLYQIVQRVSEQFGYQEFDGPEVEYLALYADKTSEEILREQVFTLKDRDDRDLALRPEITPTFARMVAQRSMELAKPIRWYSFGRAWRYEQPQKGRGREFYQWEINILGPESPQADAEILAIAATFFQELGLTPEEVIIRVNDRSYFEQIMQENDIAHDKFMPLLRIIDRKEKISPEEFNQALASEGLTDKQVTALNVFFEASDYGKSTWLTDVFNALKAYPGALDYIVFDPTIARGFEYYTRTVFEAWDKTGGLRRALFGGGRFDNLTATLGGERVPGVGMAPGDMPIEVLLEQFGKMPSIKPPTATMLVTVFDGQTLPTALEVAATLRSYGIATECWPDTTTKLDKQLSYANKKGIPFVCLIGSQEIENNQVTIKNLTSGKQQQIASPLSQEAVTAIVTK